jgi:hypothetical protein
MNWIKIKEEIERHPQVKEVWEGWEGVDRTWWASTAKGWCTAGGTHQHHEDSLKQLLEAVTSCTVQCEADCDCGWGKDGDRRWQEEYGWLGI